MYIFWQIIRSDFSPISCSLLGQGYNLQQLLDAAEETSRIRKSREASLKGRFDSFKKVYHMATKPIARIVAAKSG